MFNCADYGRFRNAVLAAMQDSDAPQQVAIRQVLPQLMDHLQAQHQDIKASIGGQLTSVATQVKSLHEKFVQVLDGKAPMRICVDWSSTGGAAEQPVHSGTPSVPPIPATYSMNRNIHTVTDLWQEWVSGFTGPAVRQLEATVGATWRGSAKEKKFFFRRKIIVDNVIKFARTRAIPETDASHALEAERKRLGHSLASFALHLKGNSLDDLQQ